jgi:UrcA family protein
MFFRALIASAMILPLAPTAFAQDTRDRTIHYHDHQIDNDQRRERLRREIRMTARRVCNIHGSRDLATYRAERACRDSAIERAMMQLDRRSASAQTDYYTSQGTTG